MLIRDKPLLYKACRHHLSAYRYVGFCKILPLKPGDITFKPVQKFIRRFVAHPPDISRIRFLKQAGNLLVKTLKFEFALHNTHGKSFNAHLRNGLLAQLGKNIRDIIGKYLVGGNDQDVARGERLLIAVEQKCDTVQRNGCFTRTRNPLNDQHVRGFIPDDAVLITLNRGHNIFHLVVGRAAELLLQDVVADVQLAFEHQLHFAIPDSVLAFSYNFARFLTRRCFKRCFSQLKIIKHSGYRGTPVMDQIFVSGLVKKRVNANVHRSGFFGAILQKIDSSEIGGNYEFAKAVFKRYGCLPGDGIESDRLAEGTFFSRIHTVFVLVKIGFLLHQLSGVAIYIFINLSKGSIQFSDYVGKMFSLFFFSDIEHSSGSFKPDNEPGSTHLLSLRLSLL